MKLHTERTEVERSGVASETTFRIKTTAKAFDILSSGLYTDPKLAIIRELSCNAYDAHVAAGKTSTPFEIHLPNRLEPWLHVRDWGTGLSDEDVMQLYTTYFDSTKSDSNAFIGALGLGSKSPFSYTKAFEVISRFKGKRRTYSIFINEHGIPSIARLGEINTDEANGLEVRITINPADFHAFMEKTSTALRWFPVKPTVVGYPGFKFAEIPEEHLSGEGWKMFNRNFTADYSKMTAVQGNVAYKVDISKLGLYASDERIMQNSHIVGIFEIGDLEVAANREEIRYDDRSKAALVKKIADVRAGVLTSIEKEVDLLKGKPLWNVIVELNKIAKRIFNDRELFKVFTKDTTNPLIKEYRANGGSLKLSQLLGHELSGFEKNYGTGSVRRKNVGNAISPEEHIVVFYNDLPTGGIARVMEWCRQTSSIGGHSPTAIVIRPSKEYTELSFDPSHTGKITTSKKWTAKDFAAELKTLSNDLGNVEFKLTSKDCPVPLRAKSVYNNAIPIFQYDSIQGKHRQYIAWKRVTDLDLDDGGLYFAIQNGAHISFTNKKGELQNVNWSLGEVSSYLHQAVKLVNEHLNTSYTTDDLYGVGSLAIKKFAKRSNWINIFDVLKNACDTYKDAAEHFMNVDATGEILQIKHKVIGTTGVPKGFADLVRDLDKKSVFKQAVLPMIEAQEKYARQAKMVEFIRKINLDLGLDMFDNKVTGYFKDKAFIDYPMLAFVTSISYQSDKQLETLFDYIKLIDRS